VWMPRYSASHCLYGNKSYRTQWRRLEEACEDDELS
jgi:hypothetical protein